jgi:hypothetical protein
MQTSQLQADYGENIEHIHELYFGHRKIGPVGVVSCIRDADANADHDSPIYEDYPPLHIEG